MSTDTLELTPDEIRRRVPDFEWYHTIDLGHGIVTPGQYDLEPYLPYYGLPLVLEGKTVLDVGPGHGFFAFECEARGATVSTAELPDWAEHDSSPAMRTVFATVREAGETYHRGAFGFALQARRSTVRRLFCNVYDLTPERVGTFDLVFCASVLLHLTDPLRAMYALRRVCAGTCIISTGSDNTPGAESEPVARFVGTPQGQAFWLPTIGCLEQMALAAGFARVERVATFLLRSRAGDFATPHATIRAYVE
jgi:tRNA (mo5U34)-methyltransferase